MRARMVGVGVLAAGAIAAAGYIGTNGSSIVPPPRVPARTAAPAPAPQAAASQPAASVSRQAEPAKAIPAPARAEAAAKVEPATSTAAPAPAAKLDPAPAPPATTAEETPVGTRPSFDVVMLRKGTGVVAGQAEPGAKVQVEVAGTVIGEAVANSRGEWVMTPAETLSPGKHVLELSAVPAGREQRVKGERQAVVEVIAPPRAIEPLAVANGVGSSLPVSTKTLPPLPAPAEPLRVVVQPGSSLWKIARDTFGAGPRYTEIWAQNRTQIANPDLIYPGQVFAVAPKQ